MILIGVYYDSGNEKQKKTSMTISIFAVLGEQLLGGSVHPLAFGQHAHPRTAFDEPGRFRGGP